MRAGEQGRRRGGLDDPAGIQDGDPVGDRRHRREAVRDEQDREPALDLEPLEQADDARRDRDVQGRRRLIGDEDARFAGERHRDHRPLEHPARKLVWIRPGDPFRVGQAHVGEPGEHPTAGIVTGQAELRPDHLLDLATRRGRPG